MTTSTSDISDEIDNPVDFIAEFMQLKRRFEKNAPPTAKTRRAVERLTEAKDAMCSALFNEMHDKINEEYRKRNNDQD